MSENKKRPGTFSRTLMYSFVFLLAYTGCATLPEPASENDTVFIIPVEINKEMPLNYTFGNFIAVIKGVTDPKFSRDLEISLSMNDKVVNGMKPGRYVFEKLDFAYTGGNRVAYVKLALPFELKPGYITIFPAKFTIRSIKDKKDENYFYMDAQLSILGNEEREKILENLAKNESFTKWKVD